MTSWKDLQWRPVEPRAVAAAAPPPIQPYVISAIPRLPVPPEEEARGFLEIAAGIEHALMIEYLYASLTIPPAFQKALEDKGVCRRDQNLILWIARQEMGHLMTVQNLRLLCGGADVDLGFDRQSADDFNPQHDVFRFELAPLSVESLARYALCEKPDDRNLTPDERAAVQLMHQKIANATVNRVGDFYAKLYWLFLPKDSPGNEIGPWKDFPLAEFNDHKDEQGNYDERGRHIFTAGAFPGQSSTGVLQAQLSDWPSGNYNIKVDPSFNREQALKALANIMAQGEGLLASSGQTHFKMFKDAFMTANDTNMLPMNVVKNPTTDIHVKKGRLINNRTAAALSKLCDGVYHSVLAEVILSMKYGDSPRKDLIKSAIAGMHDVYLLAEMILTRDVEQNASGVNAAPAFTPKKAPGERKQVIQFYKDSITDFEVARRPLMTDQSLSDQEKDKLQYDIDAHLVTRKTLSNKLT
jgi:Ferritin-like